MIDPKMAHVDSLYVNKDLTNQSPPQVQVASGHGSHWPSESPNTFFSYMHSLSLPDICQFNFQNIGQRMTFTPLGESPIFYICTRCF